MRAACPQPSRSLAPSSLSSPASKYLVGETSAFTLYLVRRILCRPVRCLYNVALLLQLCSSSTNSIGIVYPWRIEPFIGTTSRFPSSASSCRCFILDSLHSGAHESFSHKLAAAIPGEVCGNRSRTFSSARVGQRCAVLRLYVRRQQQHLRCRHRSCSWMLSCKSWSNRSDNMWA